MLHRLCQFIVDHHQEAGLRPYHPFFVLLLSQLRRWLKRNHDGLIQCQVGRFRLTMPFSHDYFVYKSACPDYGENLGRLARLIEDSAPEGSMIDVGANVGDTAALVRTHSEMPLLCLEADPGYFALLLRNLSLLTNVAAENVTVAAEEGHLSASLQAAHGTARLSFATPGGGQDAESLDCILERHPTFGQVRLLKIDCDGFDLRILRGSLRLLERCKPVVFLEYDPACLQEIGDNGLNLPGILGPLGYAWGIAYDNLGDFLLGFSLADAPTFADLHHYFLGRRSRRFMDLALFHADDRGLFESVRMLERQVAVARIPPG